MGPGVFSYSGSAVMVVVLISSVVLYLGALTVLLGLKDELNLRDILTIKYWTYFCFLPQKKVEEKFCQNKCSRLSKRH